ncbi:MAG: ferrous iron transport protein B [Deltaproteobacteria bacterium]|nr:ferrous iron transport protein B [Deltaproteobacteria bacterium]
MTSADPRRIAIAGNPNSGKTTIWNALTGSAGRVGNYPGVTVERLEAVMTTESGEELNVVDVPGCYSLTARSAEEEVAHDVVTGRLGGSRPGIVVAVVDASNLARNLYLALQLMELGEPVVVALSMVDVAAELGIRIDVDRLTRELGVPVVPVVGTKGEGIAELRRAIDRARSNGERPGRSFRMGPEDEARIDRVRAALGGTSSDGEAIFWLTSDVGRETIGDDALREVDEAFGRRVILARYAAVDGICNAASDDRARAAETRTDRVDRVLTHPLWGGLVFVALMATIFQAVFWWAQPMIEVVERAVDLAAGGVRAVVSPGPLRDLLTDGVLAGVGNILVFLPQILMLELAMAVLEDTGYMSRAAYLMDRVMSPVGLQGKAFIPLMSAFACAIPGIMAARTVEGKKDRLVTILVAPLMSCSARLPVYTLVVAAVFSTSPPVAGVLSVGGLVIASMYLLGIAAAIAVAFVLKKTLLRSGRPALVMELPSYKRPGGSIVWRRLWRRARDFTTQTGSVILALSILLWALLAFPRGGLAPQALARRTDRIEQTSSTARIRAARLEDLADEDRAAHLSRSFAGRIGHAIEPLIRPLGFDWRIGIGLVASFAAREVLVSTLGQVYAVGESVDERSLGLRRALLRDVDPRTGRPRFTPLVGISLMVFFVLACQCLSTVAVVRRETNSIRWPVFMVLYMNTLAWIASFVVFQAGRLAGLG